MRCARAPVKRGVLRAFATDSGERFDISFVFFLINCYAGDTAFAADPGSCYSVLLDRLGFTFARFPRS